MFVFGGLVNLIFVKLVFGVPAVFNEENVHPAPTLEELEALGNKIYGNPLRSSKTTHSLFQNYVTRNTSYWPDKTIPYEINPNLSEANRKILQKAFNEFHNHTCLKFREKSSSDTDYIYINNSDTGCWASVGRVGGSQLVNLADACFRGLSTVLHELMHAVGFQHEQCRPDRDEYLIIYWDNIEESKWSNFDKMKAEDVDDGGVGYDYNSIMHYVANAFAMNPNKPSMKAKVKGVTLGPLGDSFTEKDIQKMRIMYKCDGEIASGILAGVMSIIYIVPSFFSFLCFLSGSVVYTIASISSNFIKSINLPFFI